jgi:hypothetical protein
MSDMDSGIRHTWSVIIDLALASPSLTLYLKCLASHQQTNYKYNTFSGCVQVAVMILIFYFVMLK